jgi:hypothetical protein
MLARPPLLLSHVLGRALLSSSRSVSTRKATRTFAGAQSLTGSLLHGDEHVELKGSVKIAGDLVASSLRTDGVRFVAESERGHTHAHRRAAPLLSHARARPRQPPRRLPAPTRMLLTLHGAPPQVFSVSGKMVVKGAVEITGTGAVGGGVACGDLSVDGVLSVTAGVASSGSIAVKGVLSIAPQSGDVSPPAAPLLCVAHTLRVDGALRCEGDVAAGGDVHLRLSSGLGRVARDVSSSGGSVSIAGEPLPWYMNSGLIRSFLKTVKSRAESVNAKTRASLSDFDAELVSADDVLLGPGVNVGHIVRTRELPSLSIAPPPPPLAASKP